MQEAPVFFPGSVGVVELIIILMLALFSVVITLIPFWMIFKKAGFHPAMSLLMLVPLVNCVMIFVLAFAPWPALQE